MKIKKCWQLVFPLTEAERLIEQSSQINVHNYYKPQKVGQHVCLLSYRAPIIRALINTNKYHASQRSAKYLATELDQYLSIVDTPLILTAVPLPWWRLRKRGYNQVENIIDNIPKKAGMKKAKLLKRNRFTKPQTSLTRDERIENMKDAFSVCNKKYLRSLTAKTTIVLVDDVLTTGATMEASRSALRENTRAKIISIALAH